MKSYDAADLAESHISALALRSGGGPAICARGSATGPVRWRGLGGAGAVSDHRAELAGGAGGALAPGVSGDERAHVRHGPDGVARGLVFLARRRAPAGGDRCAHRLRAAVLLGADESV